jgi:hypothetical protein
MKDLEDIELKSEIDEIMRGVEAVMKRIESALPPKPAAASIEEQRITG